MSPRSDRLIVRHVWMLSAPDKSIVRLMNKIQNKRMLSICNPNVSIEIRSKGSFPVFSKS